MIEVIRPHAAHQKLVDESSLDFEFIVDSESAEEILSIIDGYGVDASIIGRCIEADGGNTLEIKSGKGSFSYA